MEFRHARSIFTLPAFITPNTHGPRTPCRTPFFLEFGPAPGGCAPTRRAPTAGCFAAQPRIGETWVSKCSQPRPGARFLAGLRRPCQNRAGQPRNVVREGLGWVERSHAESRATRCGATLRFFVQPSLLYVSLSLPGPPAKSSTARPAQRRKGRPGALRTKLWRGHDFGGTLPRFGSRFCGREVQCGLASDAVAARDRVEAAHRGRCGV